MTRRAVWFSGVVFAALLFPGAVRAEGATWRAPAADGCGAGGPLTATRIEVGGAAALAGNDAARPEGAGPAHAVLSFSFDRAAGRLAISVDNTSDRRVSLTGIYFNVPAGVTGLSLLAGSPSKTCAPTSAACPVLSSWAVAFAPGRIRADGFGRFDAHIGNGGDPAQAAGGDSIEVLPGEVLTLHLKVAGALAGVTACGFASEGSKAAPGERIVIGAARFQAGADGGDAAWIEPVAGDAAAVDLKWFQADPGGGSVSLRWETAAELGVAGFNILRRPELGGSWERVNAAPIPAAGDSLAGAAYSFEHGGLVDGVRYEYRLETLDDRGFNTLHPPERVVPNPKTPAIKLVAPPYGHEFGPKERRVLSWQTTLRGPVRLQFSAAPAFPASSRVEFPARAARRNGSYEMALNRHEQILVDAVLLGAGSGPIYWRVVEAPKGASASAASDVYRFGAAR